MSCCSSLLTNIFYVIILLWDVSLLLHQHNHSHAHQRVLRIPTTTTCEFIWMKMPYSLVYRMFNQSTYHWFDTSYHYIILVIVPRTIVHAHDCMVCYQPLREWWPPCYVVTNWIWASLNMFVWNTLSLYICVDFKCSITFY